MPSFPLLSFFDRCGFDRPKAWIGLQVALVAYGALVLAWCLHLEHPQWAAITVMVTLQPTRGQIIEKSSYRVLGTIIGSLFGTAVAWGAQGHLAIELAAVSLWSALMIFLGVLQRSYRSYGLLLAGYSAIIVLVLSPDQPENLPALALDRILTVLIGVMAAVAWSARGPLGGGAGEVQIKARRLCADVLAQAGAAFQALEGRDESAFSRLICAIAQLQDEITALTANGKSRGLPQIEQLLVTMVDLLFAAYQQPADPAFARTLSGLAHRLHAQHDFAGMAQGLLPALGAQSLGARPDLSARLLAIFMQLEQPKGARAPAPALRKRYRLDGWGAAQSALRIFIVLALICGAWLATGWSMFQYPLVSAAIGMALSSTGVTPIRKMEDVVKGQLCAVAVALTIEGLLWPLFPSPTGQLLTLLPAALCFALVRSHRRLSLSAPDFAITVFLLLNPGEQIYAPTSDPLWRAALVAAGALVGYLAFLLIFPTDTRVRRQSLWRMITRDLQELAKIRAPSLSLGDWRHNFAARFIKIAHWANLESERYERIEITMRKGMLTLQLAETLFLLKALEQGAGSGPALQRMIKGVLARIARSEEASPKLRQSLARLARQLSRLKMEEEARIVQQYLHHDAALAHSRGQARPAFH